MWRPCRDQCRKQAPLTGAMTPHIRLKNRYLYFEVSNDVSSCTKHQFLGRVPGEHFVKDKRKHLLQVRRLSWSGVWSTWVQSKMHRVQGNMGKLRLCDRNALPLWVPDFEIFCPKSFATRIHVLQTSGHWEKGARTLSMRLSHLRHAEAKPSVFATQSWRFKFASSLTSGAFHFHTFD